MDINATVHLNIPGHSVKHGLTHVHHFFAITMEPAMPLVLLNLVIVKKGLPEADVNQLCGFPRRNLLLQVCDRIFCILA